MKAIVLRNKQAVLVDHAMPVPQDNEVLIQVKYAGFCRTDAYVAQGKIEAREDLVLGHEFSGIIANYGKDVKKFAIGDRVAVMPILKDEFDHYTAKMYGVDLDGCFAEFVTIEEDAIFKIPDTMDFQKAAYLEPIAATLSIFKAPIKPEMKGLIQGDNRFGQITKKVLESKFFCNLVIVDDTVLGEIEDNTFDFVIETFVNNDNIDDLVRVLKPGGILVLKSRSFFRVNIRIDRLVKKDLKIFANYYGDFEDAIEALDNNVIEVDDIFGEELGFEEFRDVINGDKKVNEQKKLFLKVF